MSKEKYFSLTSKIQILAIIHKSTHLQIYEHLIIAEELSSEALINYVYDFECLLQQIHAQRKSPFPQLPFPPVAQQEKGLFRR